MIKYLDDIKEGELFSAYLARLFEQSVFIYPKQFEQEIFSHKQRLDHLHINKLNSDFQKLLDKNFGFENIILNHTLVGFENLFGNYKPKISKKRYIRYCPDCIREGNVIRVVHQIEGINCCPYHECKLENSQVSLNREKNYRIQKFSFYFDDKSIFAKKLKSDDINVKLAKYIKDILNVPRNALKYRNTGGLLRSYMPQKYFIANTRVQLNVKKLLKAINSFYKGLDGYHLTERRLKLILNNETYNPFFIILIAFFLNIEPFKLVNCIFKERKQIRMMVRKQKKAGLTEREIAKSNHISKTNVHKILQKSTLRN